MALSSAAIGKVALNALSAMAKIFLISMVGVCCAKYPRDSPLLPPAALKTLSRLSNLVLLPALIIVSLGSSLSVAMVARLAVLILFCILNNLISYSIAYTLGFWLHENDKELFLASSVAVGSPNAISFPLMLMQTLCEQSLVASDFLGDSAKCMAEANSMLFVYSIGWHLMFWSYGYQMLKTLSSPSSPSSSLSPLSSDPLKSSVTWLDWLNQTLCSPSMLAIYVGLFVGLLPPVQNALFRDFTVLRPVGSALRTLSEPLVCVNCLVMSANLAQIDASTLQAVVARVRAQAMVVSMDMMGWSAVAAAHTDDNQKHLSGLNVVASPLHNTKNLESDDSDARIAAVNDNKSCVGSSSSFSSSSSSMQQQQQQQQQQQHTQDSSHALPQARSIFSFLLCRLVLPPLVMLPVLKLSVDAGIVRQDERLMQLVICIEAAAPSAQLIIVSLTQLGKSRVAAQIAVMYVSQYLFCIITVTAWVAVAMSQFY